jgi:hypothetical protein
MRQDDITKEIQLSSRNNVAAAKNWLLYNTVTMDKTGQDTRTGCVEQKWATAPGDEGLINLGKEQLKRAERNKTVDNLNLK